MSINLTLCQAWHHFYHQFSINQVIGKTDLTYWTRHVKPFFQNCQLSEINTAQLLNFKIHLEQKKLSPQTVHHCLALLKRIYNKLKLIGLYDEQIPIFIMPKFDNQRLRYLTPEEAEGLLSILQTRTHTWHGLSVFALNTGMRAGEIFQLRCYNINLATNSISVVDTKTSKNRIIPLNQTAKKIVLDFYTKPSQLLFHSRTNQQIGGVSQTFRKSVEQSGLNKGIKDRRQKIVFHSLRHTFASWLVQKGVPLEVVSKLLGHRSLHMTQRYAHLAMEQQQQAVMSLDSFFGN